MATAGTDVNTGLVKGLGLTDATILILLESGGSLLSADFELCGIAARAGLDATNSNHIRPLKT